MNNFWRKFSRVLKAYSIEEKVISILFLAIAIFISIQMVIDFFKNPEVFADDGGRYIEGLINSNTTTINPVYADFSEANREVSSLVFSGLTKYDPNIKAFTEDVAKLKISEDKKKYTFEIKDGIYWHDGEKLTAEDVYFTYHDVIQNQDFQNPVLKANFAGVTINLVNDKKIEFVLQKPNSFFITNLNTGILPKHILENVAVPDLPSSSYNLKPIGTGPYAVKTPLEILDDGRQRVSLELFDKYYGTKPKIAAINFHIYPDAESLYKERGTLNIISKVPKDIMDDLSKDNRFKFISYELPQYTAVFLNMTSVIVKKDKVRIALEKAIDKTELLKQLQNKTEVDTPLMELNQSDWINKSSLEQAKGALFDSGYKMGQDPNDPYRKMADGTNLKLVLLVRQLDDNTSAQEMTTVVNFLVNSWKAAGIEVVPQFEQADVFSERLKKRDYDLMLTGESLGYNFDTYSYWHSSQANENGLNLSNFKTFAADAMIERIRLTFDATEKEKSLKELAEIISTEIPAIFLYRPIYNLATDGKVQGLKLANMAFPSDRFAFLSDWCIKCQ